ncbi:hypothetical protein QBC38DRAFT_478437 [Podospora fimiseda]|uniref:Uncharacterized protein n=1 Tax=Podospora fimiseda TaxID=252190 RepID=A0AAN7BPI5_9PEZI|nr:hypothetical protein QBC38DRAFT_478437 [Podospora fimiseda]
MNPNPDADPAQAVDGLVRAIRDLTSDPNYKLVADVFSEFLYVKEQNNKLSSSHQVVLEEYRKFRNELEDQKAILDKEKREMEVLLQEKTQEIMQLTVNRTMLEADLDDVRKDFDEQMRAAAEAAEKAARDFRMLKETKEREFSEMRDTKEREFSSMKESKEMRIADLAATKSILEKEKKNNEEAAAAAAAKAAAEIAQLTEAKTGLEANKVVLEKAKADNEAEITKLKEMVATLEAQKKKLEEELTAANKQVSELTATLAQKNIKIESLEESLRVAEEQIASLQQTVEEKNGVIEELHTKLTSESVRAEKAEALGQDLQIRLEDTERNLRITEDKLADLEEMRIEMEEESEDTYVAVLDKIWTTIITLVESTFRPDIDEQILSDASCWNNLRNSPYLKHATQLQVPLPQSNTPAAKGMRISAVLAVLSRAMHRHIFRPVYLFDDDDENIVKFLRLLEDEDPSREAHMRATLLAMMPERQEEQGARRVKVVVREVSWLVQHLLSALQYEAFCSGLETACRLACEQWMRIQVAQMKIEPYFGPPYDDFDWQVLDLPEFADAVDINHGIPHAPEDLESTPAVPDDRLETIEATPTTSAVGVTSQTTEQQEQPQEQQQENGYDDLRDAGVDDEEMMEGEVDPDDILLVVWPSMCCVENGELMSITQGLVISKEQARPALEETRVRSKPIQRPGSRRSRTMSMAAASASRTTSPQRKVTTMNHFMMAARALSDNAADDLPTPGPPAPAPATPGVTSAVTSPAPVPAPVPTPAATPAPPVSPVPAASPTPAASTAPTRAASEA